MAFAMWFALSGVALAVVNINTATKEELTSIKGVGDKRAQEIIEYRKKNGNFKSIDDLGKVPGIGPGLIKQIRSDVTVTGKTSIDKPAKAKASGSAKGKGSKAKTADTPKGDALKSNMAKTKTAEKSKADEKKAIKN
ncbi:MAG: ComEA family DNA-binding protein [Candidatus Binatia bacterium]